MSDSRFNTTDRRRFVGAVATLGASLAVGTDTRVQRLFVTQQPATVVGSDAWLDHLKGKHRQLFDVPEPEGGTALRHLRNYRSEEHTSELQSQSNLVCRLLLE